MKKYSSLLMCTVAFVCNVGAQEIIGEWSAKERYYTLLKDGEQLSMLVRVDNQYHMSSLEPTEGIFPLPTYKVISGYQSSKNVTYTVNIRNIVGIRKNNIFQGYAQPVSASPQLLKEFKDYHATPEFHASKLNEKPLETNVNLTITQKKHIFSEHVKLEDNGVSKSNSVRQTMERFNISEKNILTIIYEGYLNDWLSEIDG